MSYSLLAGAPSRSGTRIMRHTKLSGGARCLVDRIRRLNLVAFRPITLAQSPLKKAATCCALTGLLEEVARWTCNKRHLLMFVYLTNS